MFVLIIDTNSRRFKDQGPEVLAEWVRSVASQLAAGESSGTLHDDEQPVGRFTCDGPDVPDTLDKIRRLAEVQTISRGFSLPHIADMAIEALAKLKP